MKVSLIIMGTLSVALLILCLTYPNHWGNIVISFAIFVLFAWMFVPISFKGAKQHSKLHENSGTEQVQMDPNWHLLPPQPPFNFHIKPIDYKIVAHMVETWDLNEHFLPGDIAYEDVLDLLVRLNIDLPPNLKISLQLRPNHQDHQDHQL